jgi:hypothetical protein
MRKLFFLICFMFAPAAFAAPDTLTSSVCFQDPVGNCLASGSITFKLNVGAKLISNGQVVNSTTISYTLTTAGVMPAGAVLYGNDQLMPTGTYYVVSIFNSNGLRVRGPENWIISGVSPIDLSLITSASVPDPGLASPVIQNPVASQTITQPVGTVFTIAGPGTYATSANGSHTGTEVFNNINGVIYADQQSGSDFAAKINAALVKATAGGGSGIVNACGFSTVQTASTNMFAGITGAATIYWPYQSGTVSIAVGQQITSPIQINGCGNVDGASPAQAKASASWPVITISTAVLTSNVVTVTTSTNHGFSTGNPISISGTTDTTLQGVFFITVTGLNTFTYPLTLSNRSATGGSASPPMFTVGASGGTSLVGVQINSLKMDGNGVVPVLVANIAGQELTTMSNDIFTNYVYRGLYIGGPMQPNGTGNAKYEHNYFLFNSGNTLSTGIELYGAGAATRYAIRDTTIVSNGTGVSVNCILAQKASLSVLAEHCESHTNNVNLVGGTNIADLAVLTASQTNVTNNIQLSALGEVVHARGLFGATNAVLNNLTSTTLTGQFAQYTATSNGGETWLRDDGNKTLSLTGSWSIGEGTAPSGTAARDTCYGDSTAHALECSFNNDTFAVVPKTNNAPAFTVRLRATQFVADQGSACTNGELALSAGWGNTAAATAVAGQGQTCQWTITASGTGQAANPTITDTLTSALPSANVVCDMRMVGGTGTATLINQTALSATAPVFTFGGTPGAGSTYFVVRRCGP